MGLLGHVPMAQPQWPHQASFLVCDITELETGGEAEAEVGVRI